MSRGLPDQVDVWRMVSGRRCFSGQLPLASLPRLRDSLADVGGTVDFELEFDTDEFDQAFVELRAQGELPLICQRTLEVYRQPVAVSLRLGLIRREQEEAALLPGYEALLVPADGMIAPADLIEDELILALPLVPARPDSVLEQVEPEDTSGSHPFAALRSVRLQ
jgi:uncharacterized protein